MTGADAERRLATIYGEIAQLGLQALVMGGHAVRFYGVDRSTFDYDLVIALSPPRWDELARILKASPLFSSANEGSSWRPSAFRRFVIGTLPDGRTERLEFWRQNHLLAQFSELDARKVVGQYGGAVLGFLSIEDLIRSKETERDDDWRDVRLLEEIADERRLAVRADAPSALAVLRSQRGFETARRSGLLGSNQTTRQAAAAASHPVSRAFLQPYERTVSPPDAVGDEAIESILAGPLAAIEAGSARHLALVEAVRRLYQRRRMAEDRADKERAALTNSGD